MKRPPERERHNAKARRSVAGGNARKRRRIEEPDVNAPILEKKDKDVKNEEKKERMREELMKANESSKWTKRKKARLDKYIDKKLAKEERVDILAKLEQSQKQVDSISMARSSMLGTGHARSQKEMQEMKEHKQVTDAINRRGGDVSNVSQKSSGRKKTSFPSWRTSEAAQQDSDSSFDSSDSENDLELEEEWSGITSIPNNNGEDGSEESDASEETDANEESEFSEEEEVQPKKRSLGFKAWATKQLSIAKGYDQPDTVETSPIEFPVPALPSTAAPQKKLRTSEKIGPLGESITTESLSPFARHALSQSKQFTKPTTTATYDDESIPSLPILSQEHEICEAVLLNPVVYISGETGSGKTTQVPRILHEAGWSVADSDNPGMIGITQPRRVATVAMAERVASEVDSTNPNLVAYQIRYTSTVSPGTRIKFMTEGVLLREVMSDFLLVKYSILVIDEAHERSLNGDVLLGVLSRVVKLRQQLWLDGKAYPDTQDLAKPLRLVIMSATLSFPSSSSDNEGSSTKLFETIPPTVQIPSRQHPITSHFARRTSQDYVTDAVAKVVKIHKRLPAGGVLVFVTSGEEVRGLCKELESRFGPRALAAKKRKRFEMGRATQNGRPDEEVGMVNASLAPVEEEDIELSGNQHNERDSTAYDLDDLNMDTTDDVDHDPEALHTDDEDEIDKELGLGEHDDENLLPMHILPLYSLLPPHLQKRVFDPPPEGSRLVVVATNVAETSITIPGVRYVVDTGRVKEKHLDPVTGTTSFPITFISKASAKQRAGRAGRTGPGHCYRLYSSAVYEHYFADHTTPEILRTNIETTVLMMKSMGIDKVISFPFPTPPDRMALIKAERGLEYLGAISSSNGALEKTITSLGQSMALFPLSPRYSRMLVGAAKASSAPGKNGVLQYAVIIVCALSVGEVFIRESSLSADEEKGGEDDSDTGGEEGDVMSKGEEKERRRMVRKGYFKSLSTHSSLGNYTSDAFRALSVVGAYEYAGGGFEFCKEHFIRQKAMEEIHKLRAQISALVQTNFPSLDAGFVPKIAPPNDMQIKILRQLLAASLIDQVAIRKDLTRSAVGGTKFSTTRGVAYRATGISEDVFIHPSSVVADRSPPDYIVFEDVVKNEKGRIWLKGITIVNPAWLANLGKGTLCTFTKPVKNAKGELMVIPRFGPESWELPAMSASSLGL